MPVKGYRVRYVVLKMENIPPEDHGKLIELVKEECKKHQPGFRFKAIQRSGEILVFKCPHRAVPTVRTLLSTLAAAQPSFNIKIIGVSGTLRKAYSKFCRDAGGKAGQRL